VYIVGAILCLLVGGVLVSVVVDDWRTMPGWVSGLALFTTALLVASAVRLYLSGVMRRRKEEGPRTKIVLTSVPAPPPRPHDRKASGQ
jgi:hypothetical protein